MQSEDCISLRKNVPFGEHLFFTLICQAMKVKRGVSLPSEIPELLAAAKSKAVPDDGTFENAGLAQVTMCH